MKALLISPFSVMALNEYLDLYPKEPLGLEYLAAAAGSHDVQILDCKADFPGSYRLLPEDRIHLGASLKQLKHRIKDINPDVVGVTSLFDTQIDSVYAIFDLVASIDKNIVKVIGGCTPSCYPIETLQKNKNIDIAVFGEGEITFRDLLDNNCANLKGIDGICYRENGRIIQNNPRELIRDLDSLPFPRRDLVNLENYTKQWETRSLAMFFLKTKGLPYVLGRMVDKVLKRGAESNQEIKPYRLGAKILTSRGCPLNCYFCAVKNLWGAHSYRMRSAENVLAEMELLYDKYNVRHFGIVDENFNASKKRAIAICKGIIERGWDVALNADSGLHLPATDAEVLTWMKKAGFNEMFFAVESGNESVVKNIIGKNIKLSHVNEIVKACKDLGIKSGGFFILGVPGETKENMAETVKYAINSEFDVVRLFTCQPYRGSRLYEDAKKNGWITSDFDSSKSLIFESKSYFKTPEFSPEDVQQIANNAKEILRQQNRLGSAETCTQLRKADIDQE